MSQPSIESVSAVVGSIYEAAYDQSRWQAAMQGLCDLFSGSRACIVRTDSARNSAVGSYLDDEFEGQNWSLSGADALARGMSSMPVGQAYCRSDVVDSDELDRSELWHGFFRPRQMDHSLNINLLRSDKALWAVDVSRATAQGPFSNSDRSLMQLIAPHVLRAGQIGDEFQRANLLGNLHSGLPFGVLVVDGSHHFHHANEAAEAILARRDVPLAVTRGKLTVRGATSKLRLRELIASACGHDYDGLPGVGGTEIFPVEQDEFTDSRLLLSIAPLSPTLSYGLASRRSAAILIHEVSRQPAGSIALSLPRLFKLSPAEARVAAALAGGKTLQDVAVEQSITVKTARSYLESVFRKTGTHRQGELVALLKSMQPLLPLS